MKTKASLSQALAAASGRTFAEVSHAGDTRRAAPAPHKTPMPPSREGKRIIAGYFSWEVWKQMRVLAAENDKNTQGMIAEALNDLFAKYGKPEIGA